MQIRYFLADVNRMLGKQKLRLLYIWLSRSFSGVLCYRLERSLFLLFGPTLYKVIRIPFLPIIYLFHSYSNIDIHYQADIKGGLLILHPALGVVISGRSVIGQNLTLVGGNCIGIQKSTALAFLIGNNCTLGANATVIGPSTLGNNCSVGASACVVHSFEEDHLVLVGVPAKKVNQEN